MLLYQLIKGIIITCSILLAKTYNDLLIRALNVLYVHRILSSLITTCKSDSIDPTNNVMRTTPCNGPKWDPILSLSIAFDQQTLWFMHLTKYCHPHIAMPLIQNPYFLHAYVRPKPPPFCVVVQVRVWDSHTLKLIHTSHWHPNFWWVGNMHTSRKIFIQT